MKQNQELLRLDSQICFQLYLASKSMTQLYRPLLSSIDLTYPQYLVMLVLWEADQIAVKELGEKLKLDSGTLSPLIKRLIAKDLVSKSRSDEDEREVILVLTKSGTLLKNKAYCIPLQMFEQIGLSKNDAQDIFKLLTKLNNGLTHSLENLDSE